MWWIQTSKIKEKQLFREYFRKVNSLEKRALEHLNNNETREALSLYSLILELPKPIFLLSEHLENQAMEAKLSRIRFKIELLKSKSTTDL